MLLRCSAAPRWMECSLSAGSVHGEMPDETSDEAREGTCAAWVAEQCINDNREPIEYLGLACPESGWFVDEDMVRHLGPYVKLARSRERPRAEVFREMAMDIAGVGLVRLAGTLDLQSWEDGGATLCIDDLKYGFGIVEPTSWQLACYMVLALREIPAERIRLGIYQPRAQHPEGIYRRVEYTRDQAHALYDKIWTRMGNIPVELQAQQSACGKWCSDCTKAAICPSLAHTVYTMWSPLNQRGVMAPTGQQLADELDMLTTMNKIMLARKKSVEAEVEGRLTRSEFIPGYVREQRVGKRQFKVSATTIKAMTGISPEKADLITPAELERRGADPETIKLLTMTPYVGHKLTRITPEKIARKFK